MNSFLDSNVILGYIFCLDLLFEPSKEYIFNSNNNYYSLHVQNEVENVFSRKLIEFTKFIIKINQVIFRFEDNDIVSVMEFHKVIESMGDIGKFKVMNMHLTLEKIWNYFNFSENQEVFFIKLNLKKFLKNFNNFNYSRKNKILSEMILIPNHSVKDSTILDVIKTKNLRDNLLHESDEIILFDANEYAKNNENLNMKFVTADEKFFNALEVLKKYLSFGDCINLIEFSSN